VTQYGAAIPNADLVFHVGTAALPERLSPDLPPGHNWLALVVAAASGVVIGDIVFRLVKSIHANQHRQVAIAGGKSSKASYAFGKNHGFGVIRICVQFEFNGCLL
jgi:hypothetical protein